MSVKIKICGITNLIDAKNALNLGADYIGFINISSSPRHITTQEIGEIFECLTNEERKKIVLLTDTGSVDTLVNICSDFNIKNIQPYGSLSVNDLNRLKLLGYRIFKPLHVETDDDISQINNYQGLADLMVLDTKSSDPELLGGTGEVFDWDIFLRAKQNTKINLALAGGLDLSNIEEAIKRCNPFMIDLSSGLESKPGIKSISKMKELFAKLNELGSITHS